MRRRFNLRFLVPLVIAGTACGGGGGGGGGDDDSGDPSGDPDAATSTPDGGETGPGLAGFLKDEDGQIRTDKQVAACMAETCYYDQTDLNGRFYFPIDPTAEVALKTPERLGEVPRRAAALCPIRIVDSALVEVGDLHVPALPDGAFIGPVSDDPQTLEVGDGLELTLSRGSLDAAVGDTLVDAAARLVSVDRRPELFTVEGEEIVAVYALHPFAATSSSPIAVRADSGLAAGTEVRFRTISEIDGTFSEPVAGLADGARVATGEGLGITELTWLVISKP